MKPGRELDKLVVTEVMGLRDALEAAKTQAEFESIRLAIEHCADFSTDIRAAWTVLQLMRTQIFSVRNLFYKALMKAINEEMEMDAGEGLHPSWQLQYLEPHHICLAALKAVGAL